MSEQTLTKPAPTDQIIIVTPGALEEVKRLFSEEDAKDNLFLRLGISSGGCSGMSYTMSFDNEPNAFDREFDFDGVKVRVDLKALVYLAGTTLDYKGGMMGGGFQFNNPNAKRSCGCGTSFTC
ncbi:MAG: iron-sulfur cluster assembly accessory protein [candidate division Zixibacteria bacterium]|nr:iron-sulfur cluster assembly accessory protein [candidate division Zixibacteria bacterium]